MHITLYDDKDEAIYIPLTVETATRLFDKLFNTLQSIKRGKIVIKAYRKFKRRQVYIQSDEKFLDACEALLRCVHNQ